jgi:hypothetical protein
VAVDIAAVSAGNADLPAGERHARAGQRPEPPVTFLERLDGDHRFLVERRAHAVAGFALEGEGRLAIAVLLDAQAPAVARPGAEHVLDLAARAALAQVLAGHAHARPAHRLPGVRHGDRHEALQLGRNRLAFLRLALLALADGDLLLPGLGAELGVLLLDHQADWLFRRAGKGLDEQTLGIGHALGDVVDDQRSAADRAPVEQDLELQLEVDRLGRAADQCCQDE